MWQTPALSESHIERAPEFRVPGMHDPCSTLRYGCNFSLVPCPSASFGVALLRLAIMVILKFDHDWALWHHKSHHASQASQGNKW